MVPLHGRSGSTGEIPKSPAVSPRPRGGIKSEGDDGSLLPSEGMDLKLHLSQLERELICASLSNTNGVVAHAAKLLRMRRTTLVEKMRKYQIAR